MKRIWIAGLVLACVLFTGCNSIFLGDTTCLLYTSRRELVTFKQLMAEEQAEKKSRLESKKGVSRSRESALNQQVREPSPERQMKPKTGRP